MCFRRTRTRCRFPHVSVSGQQTNRFNFSNTTISGGIAIQAGFLVSFKQLVPEHTVAIAKGLVRMRVKHFPAIFLLANTISGIALGTETAMFLAWFGFFTAWVYLRFYRISPSMSSASTGDGSVIKGDASDTFSFAHFFPEPAKPSWTDYYSLGHPDIAAVAAGLGADSYRVNDAAGLEDALRKAIKRSERSKRPQVITLAIDRSEVPPYYVKVPT